MSEADILACFQQCADIISGEKTKENSDDVKLLMSMVDAGRRMVNLGDKKKARRVLAFVEGAMWGLDMTSLFPGDYE